MIISTSPRAPAPVTPPRRQPEALRKLQQLRAHVAAIGLYVDQVKSEADELAAQLEANDQVPSLPIGQALRLRRLALRLKQHEVAKVAHVSRGQVSELERGRRRAHETLTAVSAALSTLERDSRAEEQRWQS